MKFVAEYRQFAEQYRKLSDKVASPKDKGALKLMARAWDRVAAEREDCLNNQAVRERLDHARLNERVVSDGTTMDRDTPFAFGERHGSTHLCHQTQH